MVRSAHVELCAQARQTGDVSSVQGIVATDNFLTFAFKPFNFFYFYFYFFCRS